ncbi:TonB-dependent receptor [Asticcacaulis sp. YBE204]|uniref:TonB-dependent receptor n=1 Tax=Asticcacaulis sp. YBE204 TaxID=1282363 RepID=UPI0004CF8087|nr:TonB-dependent receptor [Asticcacaulis sp. YBE204]
MRVATLLCAVGVVAPAVLAGVSAHAQDAVEYNLPAQPLSDALTAIGSKAGVNIVFAPDAVKGKRSTPLKGRFSVPAALDALLTGTGLSYSRTFGGSYIIRATAGPLAKTAPLPDSPRLPRDPPRRLQDVPVVVVRGYRQSLIESLKQKRSFDGLMDSIVAEDVSKLPDNNLAEALQRVAGVAVSRDQGEGRSITVRGLGPDFTRVTINGMEAQAVTEGIGTGANKSRGSDLNVFPSELFSRIDIKKTSSADQPEGSLGATVDLVTPRPFDRKGPVHAFAVQASYNDLSHRSGQRATGLISNTFDGDRLGLLVSATYAETPLELQGVHSGGWNQGTANGGFCKPTTGTGGPCDVPAADLSASLAAYEQLNRATTYHPQFYRYTNSIGTVERIGLTGSLQWQPSPRTLLTADLLLARHKTQRNDYYLEAIGFSRGASQGGKPEIVPRRVELDADQAVIYGVFDNVDVRSEVTVDDFQTDFRQASLRLRHQLTPHWGLDIALGSSRSKLDNFKELTVQIDRFNVDGYSFDIRGSGQARPVINYGFDVTDAGSWYFGPLVTQSGGSGAAGPEIRLRPNYVRNDHDIAKTIVTYDPGGVWRLETGLELKRYAYTSMGSRYVEGEANFPAPANGLSGLTTLFCGMGTIDPPGGTPRCWQVPDIDAFVRAYDLLSNDGRTALSTTPPSARGLNQSVVENDAALYTRLHFRTTWQGVPLRGDLGFRQVRTHQASRFFSNVPADTDPSRFVLTRVSRVYNDFLPSFNLTAEWRPDTLLRFSAAKIMTRPPLSTIAAATTVSVNGGRRQVTTGNPLIEPIRATSFDLAWEWYPSRDTAASVSLFYKDISTYIQTLTYVAPYRVTGLPEELLQYSGVSPDDDFHIISVVNTPGGPLQGAEINYQTRFTALPGLWSGLGMKLSYTYVISRINYDLSPVSDVRLRTDLINISRNAYNGTVYYAKGPMQVRLSASYRDRFLINVPGSWNTDASGTEPATYWDVSASYRLRPGLTLSLEGLNLTHEGVETWDRTSAHLLSGTNFAGRQFFIGLRYRN